MGPIYRSIREKNNGKNSVLWLAFFTDCAQDAPIPPFAAPPQQQRLFQCAQSGHSTPCAASPAAARSDQASLDNAATVCRFTATHREDTGTEPLRQEMAEEFDPTQEAVRIVVEKLAGRRLVTLNTEARSREGVRQQGSLLPWVQPLMKPQMRAPLRVPGAVISDGSVNHGGHHPPGRCGV